MLAPAQTQEATFSAPSLGEAQPGFLIRNNVEVKCYCAHFTDRETEAKERMRPKGGDNGG